LPSGSDPACNFDPDPSFYFDADPDPACHFDPDPSFHFDADPDPSFKIKTQSQNLKKCFNNGS
jgi:hypothetical protein